jgi:hypothetical protein
MKTASPPAASAVEAPTPRPGGPTSAAPRRWAALRLEEAVPTATVILTAMLAFRRIEEPDTWWHLAAGRWIAEHRTVPRTDTLSYTLTDSAWINLQWLFDLFNFGLYSLGGATLVVIAGTVLFAAGMAFLLRNMRLSLGPVVASLLALWALAIAQGRFTIRPEMMSFLFLQIVLWVCMTGTSGGGRRWWLLVPVMILWVNTHSLFVIGAFVIGCYMAATAASALRLLPARWYPPVEPAGARTILVAGAVALCATLLNPYGVKGILYPFSLMTEIRGEVPVFQLVGELRRSFSTDNVTFAVKAYQALFFFSLIVVGVTLLVALLGRPTTIRESQAQQRRRKRQEREAGTVLEQDARARIDVAALVVFVALAYLSTLARRNMALLAVGTAPFVAQCLAALGRWTAGRWRIRTRMAWTRVAVAIVLPLLVVAGWLVASNTFYRWDGQLHEFGAGVLEVMAQTKASAFARELKVPPPLFNDWTSGGYLAWDRTVPGGVYIYSRGEAQDTQFFTDYLGRLRQPALWHSDADHMGFQTVILFHWWASHRALLTSLLRDQRWTLVYYDENTAIFLRKEGNAELIQQALQAFQPLRERNARALLEPVSSWQAPLGRARGLQAYANLLDVMGRGGEAVRYFTRLLEIGPAPKDEGAAALRLAHYHVGRGETDRAREYLRRAAAADPTNPGILPLRTRLGL